MLVLFIVSSLLQVKLVCYHLNKTQICQAPRKSTSSERFPSKEDNKIQVSAKSSKEENKVQMSTKKVTTNGTLDDQNKFDTQRTSVGKRPSRDLTNNGIPGNLVKVLVNSRKLTEPETQLCSFPHKLSPIISSFNLTIL